MQSSCPTFHDRRRWQRKGEAAVGNYNPKVEDNEFLKLMKDQLKRELKGGVIVADHAFSNGNQLFKDTKFCCKVHDNEKKRHRWKKFFLTDKRTKKLNEQPHHARVQFESPSAFAERKFACLRCFHEDKEQQDHLMTFIMELNNE